MYIKRYSVKAEGAKNPIDTQKEGIENQIKSINPKDPNAKGRKLDLEGQKLELEKRKLAEENKEPKKTEKADTPTLPMEKPKKRYLDAAEIITLLQNTNKQFSLNQVQGCPLKETE